MLPTKPSRLQTERRSLHLTFIIVSTYYKIAGIHLAIKTKLPLVFLLIINRNLSILFFMRLGLIG